MARDEKTTCAVCTLSYLENDNPSRCKTVSVIVDNGTVFKNDNKATFLLTGKITNLLDPSQTTQDRKQSTFAPKINKVIFRPPATVILWADDTKTVAHCQPNDVFDKEKGFAMCYMKKLHGNSGAYNDLFKRWCEVEG